MQTQLTLNQPTTMDPIPLHNHPYKVGATTSREAWESVKACGWASKCAKQAYFILAEKGELTLLEIEHEAAKQDGRTPKGRSESTIIRRLSDLRINGLAEPTGKTRLCSVRKKMCVTWRAIDSIAPAARKVIIKTCPHCHQPLK